MDPLKKQMTIHDERGHKERTVRSRFIRALLLACGWILIGLAILGIFLPLVPTTPFLLAAAACFYKSSARFYNWLMNNKFLGKYILDYRNKRGISMRVKLGTLLLLWASLLVSAFLFTSIIWIKIFLMGIGIGVTIHILKIKTK